jgi:hypothetical protein
MQRYKIGEQEEKEKYLKLKIITFKLLGASNTWGP